MTSQAAVSDGNELLLVGTDGALQTLEKDPVSGRWADAVVHHAAPTRGACVVHEIMDGHRPAVWLSDRCSAQQGHADRQQTCLAHLARVCRLRG